MEHRSLPRQRAIRISTNQVAQSIETLEGRRLLSGLLEMRGNAAAMVDLPQVRRGGVAGQTAAIVDADRAYLANALPVSQISAAEKLNPALQTLLSREIRNGEARLNGVGGQSIYGTRYDSLYNVENGLPHMDLWVDSVTAALPLVKALGMAVTSTYAEGIWQLIGGFIAPDRLLDLATLPNVKYAAPSEIARPDGEPAQRDSGSGGHRGSGDSQGTVVNQWEAQSRADVFKAILPAENGSGIQVGVISDSVNRVGSGIAASQATNNLPATVNNLQDAASGTDEGRAMLELIYDIANGSGLYFHSSYGVSGHAAAYNTLKAAGVDVIADDIPNFSEPVFQQGPISIAAENAYLTNDVLVFGSAGNRNNEGLADTWSNSDANRFHNFSGGDETMEFTISGSATQTFYLHWNQPWGAATTDLDIRLYNRNADGTVGSLAFESNQNNVGNDPFEFLTFTNPSASSRSYHLSIVVENGAANGSAAAGLQLQMYAPSNVVTYLDSYTTNSPAINPNRNSDNTFAIGAVPTTNLGTIENFSSRGPITRYFNDAGAAYVTPVTKNLPQFHAADGTATSVTGFSNFFGTSAAAPNAAAIGALVLDAAGSVGAGDLTFSQLFNIFLDTAVGTSAGGAWNNAYGQGRIDALGAGFAGKGNTMNEYALELNQFGNASLDSNLANLFGQTDIDGVFFSADVSGTISMTFSDITAALDPAMALYRKDVAGYAGFEDFDDDSGTLDDAFISRSLSSWVPYTAELFNQTLNATSSDYSFVVEAPTPIISSLTFDANGDYNSTTENLGAVGDADYYSFTVPATSNGNLTITVTPGVATLDSVITLFNLLGGEVSRVDATNANGVETMTLTGLSPGASYSLRVGSYQYASSGDFSLNINFGTYLPLTATSAEGYAIFNHTGISDDVSSFNIFMDTAADIDSLYFAGDTSWTGNYSVSVTGAAGVVPVISIYDSAGALISTNLNATDSGTVSLSFAATAATRYIFAAATKTGTTGDLTFNINANNSTPGAGIALNALGDGENGANLISPAEDSDFFNFTVPANATTGTLRLANETATTDGAMALFDNSGNFIARSDNSGPGGVDTLTMSGLVPGAIYRITVLTQDYATAGAFTLQVNLNTQLGTVTGTKYHDLNADGSRAGTDPGLSGWQIYADFNNNSVLDALATYTNDPDTYSDLLSINTVDGRVTLSAQGTDVTTNSVTARATTFTPPSTGLRGYGNTWTTLGADGQVWRQGFAEFRATFNVPFVSSVSIDAVQNFVGGISRLVAYNSANVVIATVDTPASTVADELRTLTITRSQADIAYVVAFGVGASANGLDNLRYTVSEPTAITDASGNYSVANIPAGSRTMREVLQPGWNASQGAAGNAVSVTNGGTVSNILFGNYQDATVNGRVYSDLNRNGVVDGPDAFVAGVRVYADVNNNGTWEATEPNALSNGAGNYSITGITPGSYNIRQVLAGNFEPVAPASGLFTITAQSGSSFVRDYLIRRMADQGDAPAPYNTLFASGGAYHWFDPTFYMGTKVDADVDGQPNATATGDDNVGGSDEDGVQFLDPIIPGANTRIRVTVSTAGRINGWIDLNRDGDWNDAIDVVLNNLAVAAAGTYTFNVAIPVIAGLGVSFGRFRFNAAGGIGPDGFGDVGEVEDYRVSIGDTVAPTVNTAVTEYQTFQGVTLNFSEPLNPASVQPADLIAQNTTLGTNFVPNAVLIGAGNTSVTFIFSPGIVLTNGLYNFRLTAGSVSDASGNALAANYNYAGADAFFLSGDCTRDKVVNFDDLLRVAQNYGNSPRTYSQGNIDYSGDGLVGFDDLLKLAQAYGTNLFSSSPITPTTESHRDSILDDVLA